MFIVTECMELSLFLNEFNNRFVQNSHLNLLLPNQAIIVNFESNKEKVQVVLTARGLELSNRQQSPADISLGAEPQQFYELLSGKEKLQKLISRQSIICQGKFRYILLLESLFALNIKGEGEEKNA
ncbi:SCP2 sterol-binding domain-containing protein [Cytobacillus sp. IB215316]|uniref:SCP2 sterol-binding domain-containing protein n=2 Tax=Bacillaceae TaxID=186817 RepID=UPI002A185C37|nr:SCP2 sterol-binding domain-containing protein [Cytobacillus sp. IB215316]MDX8360836.1 SCP2 sterol-binding domain-containing protein [Cytobacillus sp. IB215316]